MVPAIGLLHSASTSHATQLKSFKYRFFGAAGLLWFAGQSWKNSFYCDDDVQEFYWVTHGKGSHFHGGQVPKGVLCPRLAQNFADHTRLFNSGKFLIEALEGEPEAVMVDPKLMQYGSLEIANVDRVLSNIVAKFVSLTVARATPDAAPCHPGSKTAWVMVATVVMTIRHLSLGEGCAAKLAGKHHERIVQ